MIEWKTMAMAVAVLGFSAWAALSSASADSTKPPYTGHSTSGGGTGITVPSVPPSVAPTPKATTVRPLGEQNYSNTNSHPGVSTNTSPKTATRQYIPSNEDDTRTQKESPYLNCVYAHGGGTNAMVHCNAFNGRWQ
jgi:hypothetical protein